MVKIKRELDDIAKVFSLAFNKKDTSIFRFTVTLDKRINGRLLEKALVQALDKYRAFKVRLKRSFFDFYLEDNDCKIVVHNGIDNKFTKINDKSNNHYLFKVSYKNRMIAIDFFHLLTDGENGKNFFKTIIYNYLELRNNNRLEPIKKDEIIINSENAYEKHYTKKLNESFKSIRSFQLKGDYIPNNQVALNQFSIKLNELKDKAKELNCSLSVFLISVIVYLLIETNYKKVNGKRPINVSVPVNLKQFFKTDTISNFVTNVMLSIKPKNVNSLQDVIELVKEEFNNKVNEDRIKDRFEKIGHQINNTFVKYTPLFIKRSIGIISSFSIKKSFTLTFSNLGEVDIDSKYCKNIKRTSFILIPDWAERIRCGILSYKKNLVISFGSNMIDTSFENSFKSLLKSLNLSYKLTTNGVNL